MVFQPAFALFDPIEDQFPLRLRKTASQEVLDHAHLESGQEVQYILTIADVESENVVRFDMPLQLAQQPDLSAHVIP
jgi:hypothetical protein